MTNSASDEKRIYPWSPERAGEPFLADWQAHDGKYVPALVVVERSTLQIRYTFKLERGIATSATYTLKLDDAVQRARLFPPGHFTAALDVGKLWLDSPMTEEFFERTGVASLELLMRNLPALTPTIAALLSRKNEKQLCMLFTQFGEQMDMKLSRSSDLVSRFGGDLFRANDARPVFHSISFLRGRPSRLWLPILDHALRSGLQLEEPQPSNFPVDMLDHLLLARAEPEVVAFLVEHCGVAPWRIRASPCSDSDELLRKLRSVVDEQADIFFWLRQEFCSLVGFPRPLLELLCSFVPGLHALQSEEASARSRPVAPCESRMTAALSPSWLHSGCSLDCWSISCERTTPFTFSAVTAVRPFSFGGDVNFDFSSSEFNFAGATTAGAIEASNFEFSQSGFSFSFADDSVAAALQAPNLLKFA